MIEIAVAESFLVNRLRPALAPIPVEPAPIPANLDAELYVIYDLLMADDLLANGDRRVYQRMQFKVAAVGVGRTIGPVLDLADRLDAAIRNQSEVNDYGRVHYCQRLRSVRIPFVDDKTGRHMIQLGGIYEIRAGL